MRCVRRHLSHAVDSSAAGVSQRVSACSATNSSDTSMRNRHTDETDTKQFNIRTAQTANMNLQSAETSAVTASTRTLTGDSCKETVSDNVRSSFLLGRSFSTTCGSLSVVGQSTNAVVAASAAAAACTVVLSPFSSVRGQCVTRNMMSRDGHNSQIGAASRGQRRKRQAADSDVEPDDATLTTSSTASCKFCQ